MATSTAVASGSNKCTYLYDAKVKPFLRFEPTIMPNEKVNKSYSVLAGFDSLCL